MVANITQEEAPQPIRRDIGPNGPQQHRIERDLQLIVGQGAGAVHHKVNAGVVQHAVVQLVCCRKTGRIETMMTVVKNDIPARPCQCPLWWWLFKLLLLSARSKHSRRGVDRGSSIMPIPVDPRNGHRQRRGGSGVELLMKLPGSHYRCPVRG